MSSTHRRATHRGASFVALVPAIVVAVLLAACSSDGGSDKAADTTTTSARSGDAGGREFDPASPPGETRPPVTLRLTSDATAGDTNAGDTNGGDTNEAGADQIQSLVAKGPVKLTGSAAPGWHTIDRSPKSPPAGSHRTYPGGTTQEWDADHPDSGITTYGPDGTIDTIYPDGSRTTVDPEGRISDTAGTDGPFDPGDTYDQYDSDGSHIHIGPDGTFYEDPDGTRHHPDDGDGAVDIPPLKYGPPEGDAPGKAPSGGIGEPHYLTEDGASITTQRLGEYVLSTGVEGQEVQARTQAWKKSPSAAAITALAFGVDGQRLTVDVDGTVRIDAEVAPDGADLEFGFDQGGAAGLWRAGDTGPADTVVVVWPDLSTAWVTVHDGWLSLRLQWRDATGERRGVLGSDDDDVDNDVATRDGSVVGETGVEAAVTSWLLTDDETLFDYGDGLTTASYRDDDFPYEDQEPDLASADEPCARVPEGFAREACRYDVGLTGVDDWVEPAAAFGEAVAGDAARRAAMVTISEAVEALAGKRTGSGTTTTTTGRGGGRIALSAADRSGATDEAVDGSVKIDLDDAGETATYRLVLDDPAGVYAQSNDLTCPDEPFMAGRAGYAYFDESGRVVIGPTRACDDSDRADLLPGTYYLKLVGPGSFDLNLDLIPAG